MAKNKVFIGYDYDVDRAAKDRLLGSDVNKEFDFSSRPAINWQSWRSLPQAWQHSFETSNFGQ
jgi:hypothetical protein